MNDFMPEDESNLDFGNLRVNFTDKEAESKALDPIPRGEYHVKITDIELATCGPNSKNAGKPYWKVQYTVQEGTFEGRKVWTNVMLFTGALYSLAQMMKALGFDIQSGEFTLPDPDTLIGQDLVIRVIVKPATDEYDARNEVKNHKPFDAKTPSTGESALLP